MFLIPASSLQLNCWVLVFSTESYLQLTDFQSLPRLYNCLTYTFLWTSQITFNSTRPLSRLYPDIPRPDAPVIYTGAFPILTAWPGRICYKWTYLLIINIITRRQDKCWLNKKTMSEQKTTLKSLSNQERKSHSGDWKSKWIIEPYPVTPSPKSCVNLYWRTSCYH